MSTSITQLLTANLLIMFIVFPLEMAIASLRASHFMIDLYKKFFRLRVGLLEPLSGAASLQPSLTSGTSDPFTWVCAKFQCLIDNFCLFIAFWRSIRFYRRQPGWLPILLDYPKFVFCFRRCRIWHNIRHNYHPRFRNSIETNASFHSVVHHILFSYINCGIRWHRQCFFVGFQKTENREWLLFSISGFWDDCHNPGSTCSKWIDCVPAETQQGTRSFEGVLKDSPKTQ